MKACSRTKHSKAHILVDLFQPQSHCQCPVIYSESSVQASYHVFRCLKRPHDQSQSCRGSLAAASATLRKRKQILRPGHARVFRGEVPWSSTPASASASAPWHPSPGHSGQQQQQHGGEQRTQACAPSRPARLCGATRRRRARGSSASVGSCMSDMPLTVQSLLHGSSKAQAEGLVVAKQHSKLVGRGKVSDPWSGNAVIRTRSTTGSLSSFGRCLGSCRHFLRLDI